MIMHGLICKLLFIVLWNRGAFGNLIYNERIARDNCVYIHVCSFEIVPARSLVECAIKVSQADSGLLFYDETEGACSVCRPSPDVFQLARGQIFHNGGMFLLFMYLFIYFVISVNIIVAHFTQSKQYRLHVLDENINES